LKNNKLCDIEDGFSYLKNLYRPISIKNIQKGDIITYYNIDKKIKELNRPCSDNIEHFGIISKVFKINSKKFCITIKSKWGVNGIFEGEYNLLPKFYGNYFAIWHKKK
jgi:hypothetical protein